MSATADDVTMVVVFDRPLTVYGLPRWTNAGQAASGVEAVNPTTIALTFGNGVMPDEG